MVIKFYGTKPSKLPFTIPPGSRYYYPTDGLCELLSTARLRSDKYIGGDYTVLTGPAKRRYGCVASVDDIDWGTVQVLGQFCGERPARLPKILPKGSHTIDGVNMEWWVLHEKPRGDYDRYYQNPKDHSLWEAPKFVDWNTVIQTEEECAACGEKPAGIPDLADCSSWNGRILVEGKNLPLCGLCGNTPSPIVRKNIAERLGRKEVNDRIISRAAHLIHDKEPEVPKKLTRLEEKLAGMTPRAQTALLHHISEMNSQCAPIGQRGVSGRPVKYRSG